MKLFFLMILTIKALISTKAAFWNAGSSNATTIYKCVGGDATFPWNYTLSQGDQLQNTKWYHNGKLMAAEMDKLLLPAADFGSRVKHGPNGSITLTNLTEKDSGRYSVNVTGLTGSNTPFYLSSAMTLTVSAHVLTTDKKVHAMAGQELVWDTAGSQWAVELLCGNFTHRPRPPFDVTWISPSGDKLQNTGFKDGFFFVLMSSSLKGGKYKCRLSNDTADACLSRTLTSTLEIDQTYVKFALMDRQLTDQRIAIQEYALQNQQLQETLKEQKTTLKTKIEEQKKTLEETRSELKASTNRISTLEERNRLAVSFHAANLNPDRLKTGDHLVLTKVITNQGNGYSSSTGVFTAPVSGTYCFTAATGPGEDEKRWAGVRIMQEQREVGYTNAQNGEGWELATAHTVIHLDVGQTVWLKAWCTANYWRYGSEFSGFLVSADP